MLQVHGNEISLCKWSGGTVYLCTLLGTLVSAFDIWSVLVNTYGTKGPVVTAKQTPWMRPWAIETFWSVVSQLYQNSP